MKKIKVGQCLGFFDKLVKCGDIIDLGLNKVEEEYCYFLDVYEGEDLFINIRVDTGEGFIWDSYFIGNHKNKSLPDFKLPNEIVAEILLSGYTIHQSYIPEG